MKRTLPILFFVCTFFTLQAQTQATALNFDGVNDYVNITNQTQVFNYNASSTFTIEFWVKPSDKTSSQTIIGKGRRTAGKGFTIRVLNNRISFRNKNVIIGNSVATAISPTAWYHVAITYNASAVSMYINGVLKVTGTMAIQPIDATLPHKMFIGARRADDGSSTSSQKHFKGTLDDIRFWNVVRTATDIADKKDCQVSNTETGLVSYLKCNQGFNNQNNSTQTTLISSNATYNGTLNGFALTGITSNFSTSTNVLNDCSTLSVQNDEVALNIKVFPNPSNGRIIILNGTQDNLIQLDLMDINGRLIQSVKGPILIGDNSYDFSSMVAGIYFLNIKGEKGVISKKLIIE